MITNFYLLNKNILKIKFIPKYLSSFYYEMAYSETRIVIGGLAHVPILIFIANFIKSMFGIKTEETKDNLFKEELVKIIEVKDILVKEEKVEAIKELSNKVVSIGQKADEVFENVKKIKIDKKKK